MDWIFSRFIQLAHKPSRAILERKVGGRRRGIVGWKELPPVPSAGFREASAWNVVVERDERGILRD